MKKLLAVLLVLTLMSVSFISCKKEEDKTVTPVVSEPAVIVSDDAPETPDSDPDIGYNFEEEAEIRGSVATDDEIAFRQLPINYTEPLSAYPADIDTIVTAKPQEEMTYMLNFGDSSQEEVAEKIVSKLKSGSVLVDNSGEVSIVILTAEGQIYKYFMLKDTAGEYYIKIYPQPVMDTTEAEDIENAELMRILTAGEGAYNPDEFEEEFNQKFAE